MVSACATLALGGFAAVFFSGCLFTTVGLADSSRRKSLDFGAPKTVNLCVYLDKDVSRGDAESLLSSWDSEAPLYGLYLNPVSFNTLPRRGFTHDAILSQVKHIPLSGKCDRIVYFAGRNWMDYLYANFPNPVLWPMPEVLGEVDDDTMTHGFIVARRDSVNGLLMSPSSVTVHELYHLLAGCPHAITMDSCYDRIAALKHQADPTFFPSESSDGRIFLNRSAVNLALGFLTPVELDRDRNPIETSSVTFKNAEPAATN